jgi:dolichyl-phosphate beta-glucosyltransferase
MDAELIASILKVLLILVLIVAFFYVLLDRLASAPTVYDRLVLPKSDPQRLDYFVEPGRRANHRAPFPTVFGRDEVFVTFVVPAYNEERRLPAMLDETMAYLRRRQRDEQSFTWEVIVVDDGSTDGTADVVLAIARRELQSSLRLLRQPVNMGKGAAVQVGCLHSRGKMILMVDADGATKISEFEALERKLTDLLVFDRKVVVVGSRAHLDGQDKANRTGIRKLLGLGMHFLISLGGVRGIQDTQCGLKLFSREAAKWLFPNQHTQRWCFDAELLVIAAKTKMQVAEVPVEWNEKEGSKMNVSGMIRMAIAILQIAIFYRMGIWTVRWREQELAKR